MTEDKEEWFNGFPPRGEKDIVVDLTSNRWRRHRDEDRLDYYKVKYDKLIAALERAGIDVAALMENSK